MAVHNFTSLEAFAAHLGTVAAGQELVTYEVLRKAGSVVLRRAKAKVGHYQQAVGPFAAWAPLAQSTQDDRAKQGFSPNQPLLRTAELRASYAYVVQAHSVYIGSPMKLALWQELGTRRIPPRSVVGGALAEKASEVVEVIGGGVVSSLIGRGNRVELARG